jgi:hypothetical protein
MWGAAVVMPAAPCFFSHQISRMTWISAFARPLERSSAQPHAQKLQNKKSGALKKRAGFVSMR